MLSVWHCLNIVLPSPCSHKEDLSAYIADTEMHLDYSCLRAFLMRRWQMYHSK